MTDDQLDDLIRLALSIRHDHSPARAAAAAMIVGVPLRTDIRLTRWTHETDGAWVAAMVGADDPREADADDDGSGREQPRLFLGVAPSGVGWRAVVVALGGIEQPLAEAVEDTIGKAMSRAERDAWMLVHRDPTLARQEADVAWV